MAHNEQDWPISISSYHKIVSQKILQRQYECLCEQFKNKGKEFLMEKWSLREIFVKFHTSFREILLKFHAQ